MKEIAFFCAITAIFLGRAVYYYKSSELYNGKDLELTGYVSQEPTYGLFKQKFFINSIQISLPRYPEVSYGDFLSIRGKMESGMLKDAHILKHDKNNYNILIKLRQKIINFYSRNLPANDATLVAGMVIGSKKGMDSALWDRLIDTGLAHVVVASGANVAMVSQFLLLITVFFKRKLVLLFVLVGVWSYVMLSGFDPPIIRAGIFGSLIVFAQGLGKRALSIRLLFLTAFTMLFIKPIWITDLSFVLSFSATLSMMLFAEKIYLLIYFVPTLIRQNLATVISAQIGVGPFLVLFFGRFNLLSIFYNLLVIEVVPLITLIGLLAGFMTLVSEPLARVVLYLTYPLTTWFLIITGFR